MGRSTETVVITGAKEHNLQNVDLEFPRDALITFTGVSGSGKSSLAYQTIYKEGQRRFLESLSSYARQFLGRMEKPKVDHIDGLSPTVSISQKAAGYSPRSTVGTLTEVLDFLRLFMARLGTPTCPTCGAVVESWSLDRITEAIADRYLDQAVMVLAPVVRERKGEYRQELRDFRQRGFVRARIDGELRRLDEEIELHRYKYHSIELVIDRLRLSRAKRSRLAEAVEQALDLADGLVAVLDGDRTEYFSTRRACPEGHGSLPELEPRLFSFNSPVGACATCDGLGETHSFSEELLVLDSKVSVRDGALACITAEGKLVYSRLTLDHLEQVADEFGFSLDDPWEKLKKKDRRVLLHGSKAKQFEFRWRKQGARYAAQGLDRQNFGGIIGHLEKVYRRATARHLDRFRAATPCPACEGARLKEIACAVTYAGHSLPAILAWTVSEARSFFGGLELRGAQAKIGVEILRAIEDRLHFLEEVGLGYLTLDRRARTLSGGESQRIRLAAQVGSGLRGVLYILDEPSIGLHARDQGRLLQTLGALRDRGNTVCVVEHDEQTMRASDFLVDVGPGAGRDGGHIVVAGSVEEVERSRESCTGAYLRGDRKIPIPTERRPIGEAALVIHGACQHNLKKIDVSIPLGLLVAVTGVSGSGKSTLINNILKRALWREIHGAREVVGKHRRIEGIDRLDKVIEIDQSPIGRTPRSNPATYTGLWSHVRDLFAAMPEARLRDYRKGRFSFNVPGGRCESCDGAGRKVLEMQFLAPVEITCEDCLGKRFNDETLEILFKDHSVHDVLEMTVIEAEELFGAFPKIARILRTLLEVGLGYVKLGQPSTTLSGGEAQRMKLASELHRPATGRTIYLLDEPTTGLHFADIETLLAAIHRLVEGGNTVVVIEHNLDVVKNADWVIDLGPEGGEAGGYLVAVGTPEDVAKIDESHTGRALAEVLGAKRRRKPSSARVRCRGVSPVTEIEIRGASKNNLAAIDARLPLNRLTVVTGVSGSGKSSLAFDTLFSEGQRRFVESMSTYARRFLGRMDRAPVERLDGLGPAIAIEQRVSHGSPRSTVATTTEIHDYLRLLYARVGRPHCPEHGQELTLHTPGSIARTVLRVFEGRRGVLLLPVAVPAGLLRRKREFEAFLEDLREQWRRAGYVRAMVNGREHRLESAFELPGKRGDLRLSLILDRLAFKDRRRLVDGIEQAAAQGDGRVVVRDEQGEELVFSLDRSCSHCGFGVPDQPHPRYFSFNHHSGACGRCSGMGAVVSCDPQLLVNHPERPLFRGAIRHKGAAFTFLTRRSGWYHKVATVVARKYGIDLDIPFEDLDGESCRILLDGLGSERFQIVYRRRRANSSRTSRLDVAWKGLRTQVEQWFHQPESTKAVEYLRPVMKSDVCTDCAGDRLGLAQRSVTVGGVSLPAFTRQTVADAQVSLQKIRLRKTEREISKDVIREIQSRLGFLNDVGLGYLTLDRSAATLSGGEAQRIRLATQLGNRLVGVLYVLDEPTVGLHPRDTDRLLSTLMDLRDLGNTVVVVEHDERMIRAADWVLDLGPGAGQKGGRVVACGPPAEVARADSLTGRYLRRELRIETPQTRRQPRGGWTLEGLRVNNLKKLTVEFPAGVLTAVTGVSGSGKSSLVLGALLPALRAGEFKATGSAAKKVSTIVVDQSPVGTTPSSNPATYVNLFTPIRQLFAALPESRVKGFGPGRFSFNLRGGRCEACEGKGQMRIEMHFLADVWVTCEVCKGQRYNAETLAVRYRSKHIADVLNMEVADATDFFGDHPRIAKPLALLADVGLDYLRLGQPANTLSGGESQRIKLVAHLARRSKEGSVFLLDEPTTGLHLDDVAKLILVFQRLVDRGDAVIVIEHHLDVIKSADRVIELGPEAGDDGGEIIAQGTPEEIARVKKSHTGRFLADLVGKPVSRRRSAGAKEGAR